MNLFYCEMSTKKSKTAKQWVQQFPEDLVISAKEKVLESGKKQKIEILHCKFCAREFEFNTKISNRIREHIQSKIHLKLKNEEKERQKAGKQLTIEDMNVRRKETEEKRNSAMCDFVYALVLSASPIISKAGPASSLAPGSQVWRTRPFSWTTMPTSPRSARPSMARAKAPTRFSMSDRKSVV